MSLERVPSLTAPTRDLLRHGHDTPIIMRGVQHAIARASDVTTATARVAARLFRPSQSCDIERRAYRPITGDTMTDATPRSLSLLERLDKGPVICAEGYLFECERRGYLQAGAFVPEVVLEHPEVVEGLHREFAHAGSDVIEAFTYYGHREKLRVLGKEDILEPLNRQALAIAARVARDTGTLLAGNLSNTNVYEPGAEGPVRAAFTEQVSWAAEAGVDFIIAETFSWAGEALLALEIIREA